MTTFEDDDWEVLEEESIYVNLVGVVETGLITEHKVAKLVGLDSHSPMLQIGPAVFQGEYEDVLGTMLHFHQRNEQVDSAEPCEDDATPSSTLGIDSPATQLKRCLFIDKSSKCLQMERVFLNPKDHSILDVSSQSKKD